MEIGNTQARLQAVDNVKRFADALSITDITNADIEQTIGLFEKSKNMLHG